MNQDRFFQFARAGSGTFAPGLRRALLFAVCALSSLAAAQGVHVTLRAKPSPSSYDAYADVVASGNYAYLATAGKSGVYIYDVTNPDSPKLASHYAGTTKMEGIQVGGGVGYFGSDSGGGVHIVNLSDPTHPSLITRITSATGGYDNVHDLTYDGAGHLFVPDYCNSNNVQVWNVSSPATPILHTTLAGTDSVCVHDVTVKNNRLYISGWGGTIDIWNIANIDTQAPTQLGSFSCGVHSQDVSVTDDGNYLFCPREAHPPVQSGPGDVRVFDISDPANVTMVADLTEASLGISASSPSTTKIMGNLLFVAWYQDGLAIFDITDPTHPVFVGNYDTWPGAVKNNGDGDWGVWPYLGLDRVLVSDRTTGLYVLDASNISSQPAVFGLGFNPATLTGSLSSTGTLYLVGVVPTSGFTANLTSNNSAAASGPITVPAGATSGTFSESTSSVSVSTTAILTASDGTYSAAANLTLQPPALLSLGFSPKSTFGAPVTGTVTLSAPAAVDTTVNLSVTAGSSAIVSAPSTATVAAGFSTGTFPVSVHSVSTGTVVKMSATLNGVTKAGSFTVSADTPSSLTFSPTTVTGGNNTTGTVKFPAPLSASTTVTLAVLQGGTAVNSIPASVTAAAGSSSVQFVVGTNVVSTSTTVKISATANGGTKTASFTVK